MARDNFSWSMKYDRERRKYDREFMALIKSRPSFPPKDHRLLSRAYSFAADAHQGQFRKSGEAFISHPLQAGRILADWGADAEIVAAALLHDVVEDTRVTIRELRRDFGSRIADLVDGVTEVKEKNYRTKLISLLIDPEKIEIGVFAAALKLADRMHNMRTLGSMPIEKQQAKAKETHEFYLPIANLLGIWVAQEELGNWAMRVLQSETYERLQEELERRKDAHWQLVAEIADILNSKIDEHRVKDLFLLERELQVYNDLYRRKHEKDGKRYDYEESFNTVWMVAIVESEKDCDRMQDLLLGLFEPPDGSYTVKDYIDDYRDNFYRSLHVTVPYANITVKFQIRTWEMHESADYGVVTHSRYRDTRPTEAEDSRKHINFVAFAARARSKLSHLLGGL